MTGDRVGKPSGDAEGPLPEKGHGAQRLARTILGAMPVGAVIIDPATHRIEYANRTASGMTGIPEEDLEGSICHGLICPAPSGMCPVTDLAQELSNSRKALLRADESHRDVLKTACRIVLDGRERLLEVFIDVADRRPTEEAAEKELQRKANELETFANNIPDMAWLKDKFSNFIVVNKAFADAVGMDRAYLTNNTCDVCFGKEGAAKFKADDKAVMAAGKQMRIEESIVDAKGNTVYLETIKSPLFDENGEAIGTAGIARDVTARKLAEERLAGQAKALARSERSLKREIDEKNDFLRTVSHDLGAPLRNIMGMVDSITRRYGEDLPEEVKDRLARARLNAEKEMALIGELLELSRIRTRRGPLQEVEVGELVRSVADSLTADLEAKAITLAAADAWPVILCERPRLAQVFQNLIDNAAKYMELHQGARIEAGWQENETHYVFHVRDNGPGIPAEDQKGLFHVFRRGRNAASKAEGKGVGLAAVKAIAETYDGEAWVESEVGKGSTFSFSLAKARVKRGAQAASGADLPTE